MVHSRLASSLVFRTRHSPHLPGHILPRWPLRKTPSPSFNQRRHYVYRLVNHRQLLASWNTVRLWFREPFFYFNLAAIAATCGLYYLYNREQVPVSGRIRFNYVSDHWEKQLASRSFQTELDYHSDKILPPSSKEHDAVQRVLDCLVPNSGIVDTQWEVHVIDDPSMRNAFVLPGGKVFVYSGLLHTCSSDDDLATVLSHEMGHSICRHASETASHNLVSVPLFVISALASGLDPDLVNLIVDVTFRLPRSRVQEREADYIGLLIMAKSGYDPAAAIRWWKTMEDLGENETLEYLSTHPNHHSRLRQFFQWLGSTRETRLLTDSSGRFASSSRHDVHRELISAQTATSYPFTTFNAAAAVSRGSDSAIACLRNS